MLLYLIPEQIFHDKHVLSAALFSYLKKKKTFSEPQVENMIIYEIQRQILV